MSEADEIEDITNAAGTGAVDFPNGLNIAGSNSGIVGAKHTVSTTEPSTPSNGDTWYNTNGNLYYVRINNEWKAWLGTDPRTASRGSRGWSSGGRTSESETKVGGENLQYFDISTQGSTTIADDIFSSFYTNAIGYQANGTRGSDCLQIGGNNSGNIAYQIIVKFNCATLGSAQSHGSLVSWLSDNSDSYYSYDNDTNQNWMNNGSISDGDRCVFQAGYYHAGNNGTGSFHADIGYCSIETSQDAQNFGDLTQARRGPASGNDPTRAVFSSGGSSSTSGSNRIDYVTIQTTGDATDFGDYTYSMRIAAGAANDTRFIETGGNYNSGSVNTLYNSHTAYITIQTTGDATTFGNLTVARNSHACMSDGTYCVTSCGNVLGTPDYTLVNEYQSFDTLGNATQFTDLAGKQVKNTSGGSGNAA